MMRIDLPKVLKKGEKFIFKVDWNYNIPNRMKWAEEVVMKIFLKMETIFTQ
jgi:hypothetical protein